MQPLATSRYLTNGQPLGFYTVDATIDPNTGLPIQSRDTAEVSTTFTYDLLGRLTKVESPGVVDTTYTYGLASGATVPASVRVLRSSSDAGTVEEKYHYDSFGRLWRALSRLPDNGFALRETLYDAEGRRASVSEPVRVTSADDLTTTPAHKTTTSYDFAGRPVSMVQPDGKSFTTAYTGAASLSRTVSIATSTAGEENVSTTEVFDRHGRLHSVTEHSGTSGGAVTTSYTHDSADRLRSVAMPGQNRSFTYDGRGFLTEESHPEVTGAITYGSYDARGHGLTKSSGGVTLTYEHDAAERLMAVKSQGATIKSFTFGTSNSPSNKANGKLVTAMRRNSIPRLSDIDVMETFTYAGPGGRVSKKETAVTSTAWFAGDSFSQSQTYNTLGRVATIQYPARCANGCGVLQNPRTVTQGYTNGQLTSVDGYASAIAYHPNGRVQSISYDNGIQETWTADVQAMNRPCSRIVLGAGSALVDDANAPCKKSVIGNPALHTVGSYSFDGAGNIKAIGPVSYTYDKVSRLAGTSENGGENFAYDAVGNMTSHVVSGGGNTAPGIDSGNNRMTTQGTVYDSRGNVTSWSNSAMTFTTTWDAVGMMRSYKAQPPIPPACPLGRCDLPLVDSEYLYTADDERIATIDFVLGADFTAGTQLHRTKWALRGLDNPRLLRTFTASYGNYAVVLEDQIWRDGALLASSSGRRYYHADHLGSPRYVTNASGGASGSLSFSPYGAGGASNVTLQFTGHERDSAPTGEPLDYMHARYYHAKMGRFLSVDPAMDLEEIMREPQLWNRYSYVGNNPMRFTDPDGKERLQRYHFRNVPVNDGPSSPWRLPLMTGAMLFGGPMLRAGWQMAVGLVLGNPQGARQLADAALSPPGSSALPVNAAEETFRQALATGPEKVAGFSILGTKGMVGEAFTRNILSLSADTKGGSSIAGLFKALEGEAKAAGASQLRIVGHAIINQKLINPALAKRFGYEFRQINKDTIELVKKF